MNRQVATIALLLGLLAAPVPAFHAADKPNIVYILCDDLGYGDVHCLGGERSKIATPNIDRLAAQGMIFTDAHSSSAVCTPTRYGILTGRYNWRSRLQKGVLQGYSPAADRRGPADRAGLLKQHGYATACIGKWHLGMDISEEAIRTRRLATARRRAASIITSASARRWTCRRLPSSRTTVSRKRPRRRKEMEPHGPGGAGLRGGGRAADADAQGGRVHRRARPKAASRSSSICR